MPELKLYVPTYNAEASRINASTGDVPDYGDPYFPVVIRRDSGVRIVLGSHDYWNMDVPNILIERRPGGWAIFLHPVGGGDPSGSLYLLDDGRSFVVPELNVGSTPPICPLNFEDDVPGLDRQSRHE